MKLHTYSLALLASAGHVTLDSEFAIMRRDFDIVYDGKADDLIRDEVVIKLAMVAAPKA